MTRLFVVIGLLCAPVVLLACTTEEATAPKTPEAKASQEACEQVKDLARICYDVSDPGISCGAIRQTTIQGAAEANLRPSLQEKLGILCEAACTERKHGTSWAEISGRLDCNRL